MKDDDDSIIHPQVVDSMIDGSEIILCPSCNRLCTVDDLSSCLTCGDEYCRACDWSCSCDDLMSEIGKVMERIN